MKKFLASLNIMDYSLLLGIHDSQRGNTEELRNRSLSVFDPPKTQNKNSLSKKERKAMKKAISQADPVALGPANIKLPEESPIE